MTRTTTSSPPPVQLATPIAPPLWARGFGSLKTPGLLPTVILLAILCLLVYSNSFSSGYVLDNKLIIEADFRLREMNKQNLNDIFTRNYWWPKWESNLYRPLTTTSYLLNYVLLPDNVTVGGLPLRLVGFHAVNLALHWLNAVLVLLLARRVLGMTWPAIFVAAVFAVHPLATENVTNIVGRADLFATFFVLLGLMLHLRIVETPSRGKQIGYAVALAIGSLMGVFCKESAIVLIAIIALYDLCFDASRDPSARPVVVDLKTWWAKFTGGHWISYVAVLPSIVGLMWARYWLLRDSPVFTETGCDNPIAATSWLNGRLTAIGVIGDYFRLLIWPATLSADYSYNQIPVFGVSAARDAWTILWLILTPIIIAATIWFGRRNRELLFFGGLFWIAFFPVSNILLSVGTILGERLMYLPSIGFIGMVTLLVLPWVRRVTAGDRFPRQHVTLALALVSVVIIAGLAGRAYLRNFDWRSNVTLWSAAMEACPGSHKVYSGLATALWEENPQQPDYQRMIGLLEKASDILENGKPTLAAVHQSGKVFDDLANTCMLEGDRVTKLAGLSPPAWPNPTGAPWYEKALDASARALRVDAAVNDASRRSRLARGTNPGDIPDVGNFNLHITNGDILLRLNRIDEAMARYNYARHLEPMRAEPHMHAAAALELAHRYEEAAVIALEITVLEGPKNQQIMAFLDSVYSQITPGQPAIMKAPGGTMLNGNNPALLRHITIALQDLVKLFLDARRTEAVDLLIDLAVNKFQQRRESFDPLLRAYGGTHPPASLNRSAAPPTPQPAPK